MKYFATDFAVYVASSFSTHTQFMTVSGEWVKPYQKRTWGLLEQPR